jgi:hypothetical protein
MFSFFLKKESGTLNGTPTEMQTYNCGKYMYINCHYSIQLQEYVLPIFHIKTL